MNSLKILHQESPVPPPIIDVTHLLDNVKKEEEGGKRGGGKRRESRKEERKQG